MKWRALLEYFSGACFSTQVNSDQKNLPRKNYLIDLASDTTLIVFSPDGGDIAIRARNT